MKRKASSECDQEVKNAVKRFRPEHKRDFFTPVHQHSIESWERLIRIASYPHSTAHYNKKMKTQRSLTLPNSKQECNVERNGGKKSVPGGGYKTVGKPTAPVCYPELEIGPSFSPPYQSKPKTGLKDEQEQSLGSIQQSCRTPLVESHPKEFKRNSATSVLHSDSSNSGTKQPSNQSATKLELSPVKPSRKVDQHEGISVRRLFSPDIIIPPSNVTNKFSDSSAGLGSPVKRPNPPSKPTPNYYFQHPQNNGSQIAPQKVPLVPSSTNRNFRRHQYPTDNAHRHGSPYSHSVSAQRASYHTSQANPQVIKSHHSSMSAENGSFAIPRQNITFEQRYQSSLRQQYQLSPGKPHPTRHGYLKAKSMQQTAHSTRPIKIENYNAPIPPKQNQQQTSTNSNAQKNRSEMNGHKSAVQLVDICKDFHLLGGDLKKLEELQIAQFPFLIVPNKPNNAVHPLTALQLRLRDKYTAYLVQIVQHLDYVAAIEGTPINLQHIETIIDIFGQEMTYLKSKVSALALTYALYDVVFAKPHSHLYGNNNDIVPKECWQVCRKLYHIWSHIISSLPYRLFYLRFHARSMGLRLSKSPLQLTLLMMIQTHTTMQPVKKEIQNISMHPMLRGDSLTFDGPVRDFPIVSLEEDCFV